MSEPDTGDRRDPDIEPDDKDWTWVLDRPCPDCGFVAGDVTADQLGARVRDNATPWQGLLRLADVRDRPAPGVWSVLEYACHVRDVHRLFLERLRLMLADADPQFANWDQDVTAIEGRYAEADPALVARELMDAADCVAQQYDDVPPGAWGRRGLRANGSEFTVESLGRYHLHDVVHHLADVAHAATRATVAAYDADAASYRDGTATITEEQRSVLDRFVLEVGAGARVLEIGSGPGHEAAVLEGGGLRVRRTDVAEGFVRLLREAGHAADVVDPRVDDLTDPADPTPYDAVWASASLLHVPRADLPVVLRRLAEVTRPGGLFQLAVKEGDGDQWSTHGHVAGPRHFVLWREQPLCDALAEAGWDVVEAGRAAGRNGTVWLDVLARRSAGWRP